MARRDLGRQLTCHSRLVRSYYSVWLTLKDSDTVDEFYKYTGEELPEVGEVIDVVRSAVAVEFWLMCTPGCTPCAEN